MEEPEEGNEASTALLFSELSLFSPPSPSSLSSSSKEEDKEKEKDEIINRRRSICHEGCGRPSSVCICPYLPSHPLLTSTKIILLHHPHAIRTSSTNTLSTLPPLSSALLNLHLLSARKLRLGSHPLLDSLFHQKMSTQTHDDHNRAVVFLFPSLPRSRSLPLAHWARQTPLRSRLNPVLVVFDGTWMQAREMVTASLPFLLNFATQVYVGDCDEGAEGPSSFESELAVRKEPFKGCVSTLEAVARALRVMEPEEEVGVRVEETLLQVLRAMVGFQMRNLRTKVISSRKKRS